MTGRTVDFVPFPVPVHRDDLPLVIREGPRYRCMGCGGRVPDGAWLFETIRDGLVVGILAQKGPTGPVVHSCGDSPAHKGGSWPPETD